MLTPSFVCSSHISLTEWHYKYVNGISLTQDFSDKPRLPEPFLLEMVSDSLFKWSSEFLYKLYIDKHIWWFEYKFLSAVLAVATPALLELSVVIFK